MTTPSSFIVYRNWASEFGLPIAGDDWEEEAPAANFLTEQPGQRAIHRGDDSSNGIEFGFTLGSSNQYARPVGAVALINTNIILDVGDAGAIVIRFIDSDGAESVSESLAVQRDGSNPYRSNDLIFPAYKNAVGSADLSDIVQVLVEIDSSVRFGARDPWTGLYSPSPLFLGSLLAGPAWVPQYGFSLFGHAHGIVDRSPMVETIGGTRWTTQQPRRRRVAGAFALLSESEVEARPPLSGLRQMAEHCGISRPALLVPTSVEPQDMHQQAILGFFEQDLTWPVTDKTTSNPLTGQALKVTERHHKCEFDFIEAR